MCTSFLFLILEAFFKHLYPFGKKQIQDLGHSSINNIDNIALILCIMSPTCLRVQPTLNTLYTILIYHCPLFTIGLWAVVYSSVILTNGSKMESILKHESRREVFHPKTAS